VLDNALSKNRDALDRLLDAGAHVRYFDHHQPGGIPAHPISKPHIDTDANVCTSLLVNRYLQGRQLAGAVTAAFGDNLADAARKPPHPSTCPPARWRKLQSLGECLKLQRLWRNPRRSVFRSGRVVWPAAPVRRSLRLRR